MSKKEFQNFFNEAMKCYGDYSHTVTVMCLLFSLTRDEVVRILS